jgi:catechol 2,3-dioxygenase-like lactoylglutathione lyase family enzyme
MPSRRVVIDHLTVGVSDLERSRAFYQAALAPLGFSDTGPWDAGRPDTAFGVSGADDFIISTLYQTGAPVHIAFAAESRQQVDAFHAAALGAGATDHGRPGPRLEYTKGYYGAYVLDPDGHNVEAVFHG